MVQPQSLAELFSFYYQYVKPLYSATSAENDLPLEMLFELNAALDHIARHWNPNTTISEQQCVKEAYGHMKRACFDIFKVFLRNTIDEYKKLQKIDTSLIDNGEFDKNLYNLIGRIKKNATAARENECLDVDQAFDGWLTVMEDCKTFNDKFLLNQHVEWAKAKNRRFSMKAIIISSIVRFGVGCLVRSFFLLLGK